MRQLLIISLLLLSCTSTKQALVCKFKSLAAHESSNVLSKVFECKNKKAIHKDISKILDSKDICSSNTKFRYNLCSEVAYRVTLLFQKKIPSSWNCSAKKSSETLFNEVIKLCQN